MTREQTSQRSDIYSRITDKIIAELRQGVRISFGLHGYRRLRFSSISRMRRNPIPGCIELVKLPL